MTRWCLLAFAVLVLAIYGRHVATAGYVYEDWTVQRGDWQGDKSTSQVFGRSFERSLTRLSFESWRISPSPVLAHAINAVLHLLTLVLLMLLGQRLGLTRWAAFCSAAFFAVSPVAVEGVAYVAARGDLIATAGTLAGCCLVLACPSMWAVLVGFGLAVAGKESGIVSIVLFALVSRRWRLTASTLVMVLAGCAAVAWSRLLLPPLAWVPVQLAAVHHLLALSVIPYPLTVDYDYAALPTWVLWFSSVVVIALGLVAVRFLTDYRWSLVGIGIVWALIAVSPRLIVWTPLSVLNDHQWRLAACGLALAFGAVIDRVEERLVCA